MSHHGKPYPVPDRLRWTVSVSLLNGSQLVGNSDDEIIDRWREYSFFALDHGITAEQFKERAAAYARITWGAGLIGIGGDTPSDEFLDALAAEGIIKLSRT